MLGTIDRAPYFFRAKGDLGVAGHAKWASLMNPGWAPSRVNFEASIAAIEAATVA
jgi:hypothetical protein